MGHTIKNWLKLHDLDESTVLHAISACPELRPLDFQPLNSSIKSTSSDAQDACILSLKQYFTDFKDTYSLLKTVHWISESDDLPENAPVTMHSDQRHDMVIYCSYRNTVADFIALSHEYGHALQLLQSNKDFIPPIDREIAAFLSEHILLGCIANVEPALYPMFKFVWDAETYNYLHNDAAILRGALMDMATPYTYRFNYPLARLIAEALFASSEHSLIQDVFKGKSAIDWYFSEHEVKKEVAA